MRKYEWEDRGEGGVMIIDGVVVSGKKLKAHLENLEAAVAFFRGATRNPRHAEEIRRLTAENEHLRKIIRSQVSASRSLDLR